LAIVARPRGNDWLDDELQVLRQTGFDVVVSLLEKDEAKELGLSQEEKLCVINGLSFISFPIVDRSVPTSKTDFLKLITKLSEYLNNGKNVGVRCRQSVGRSSLIAISLLMASGIEIDDAIHCVGNSRGCEVPETKEQFEWLIKLSVDLNK